MVVPPTLQPPFLLPPTARLRHDPGGMIPAKADLRRALRGRRRDFAALLDREGRLREAADALAAQALPHIRDARVIAGYWPIGSEADPRPLLHALHDRGRAVALPRVTTPESPMTFHRWRPGDTLVAGGHGLLQPADGAPALLPDLIVTPLVGFDRRLMRMGQGAGYYDRLFARFPDIRRIGLAWSAQEVEEVPADPWDMPLHAIATEREWIEPETA
ncbi:MULTISPECIES: 5-formyltetrahydrofolate cyclo-ligase [Edaphosphingomonas]|uniref:5-formyltetrahydrofolate cyclo-ligase n=2 Tax=Edaphosphingomonas TaxID=3423724 RepID=A0A2T4HMR5_9SPHN|nr:MULTISPECIES: 5-formyltetrahydrofolate cyclo-ligase [Sphingomonas]OHT19809.1 5-formyltetrahydrofolate cyclo-ligase family protein [Sphingomonas haloaromaticamans]PTD17080.1 5-formyltetrahydrofolate cyclo-ligase [Sphingomonas fennica]